MITPVLVVATICATGAAVMFLLKARNLEQSLRDLEFEFDKTIDRLADKHIEIYNLSSELAKYKRKTRKDKGQPRKVYGGKPITNKRKVQKGEQGTNTSKSAK